MTFGWSLGCTGKPFNKSEREKQGPSKFVLHLGGEQLTRTEDTVASSMLYGGLGQHPWSGRSGWSFSFLRKGTGECVPAAGVHDRVL